MVHLTPREQETVRLLANGFTNKEIAARMGVSVNTVKAFLRSVMLKLGVTTRAGIVGRLGRSAQTD
jgi:DNA-binding CsgD family transcriptional regulator